MGNHLSLLRRIKLFNGFTLLELLTALAILGVLLVLALPAYRDYTIRTRVAEGMNIMAGVKTAVTETRQSSGNFPNSNTSAGLSAISSPLVTSVTVANNGVTTVTLNAVAVGVGAGENTLVFAPTYAQGTVSWNCTGGTLRDEYRPQNCR